MRRLPSLQGGGWGGAAVCLEAALARRAPRGEAALFGQSGLPSSRCNSEWHAVTCMNSQMCYPTRGYQRERGQYAHACALSMRARGKARRRRVTSSLRASTSPSLFKELSPPHSPPPESISTARSIAIHTCAQPPHPPNPSSHSKTRCGGDQARAFLSACLCWGAARSVCAHLKEGGVCGSRSP